MSDHYEEVLEELKEKTKKLASQFVKKLYYILRNEKQYSSDESRDKIINDCRDIWTKATIERYFPEEAKDVIKRRAGMISAQVRKKRKESQLLVVVGGDVSLASAVENRKDRKGNSVEMISTEIASNKQNERKSSSELISNSVNYCKACYEKSSVIKTLQSDIELKDLRIGLLEGMVSLLERSQSSSRDSNTIVTFFYQLRFEELRSRMEEIFRKTNGLGDIWLWGRLDINTSKIIEFKVAATQHDLKKDPQAESKLVS